MKTALNKMTCKEFTESMWLYSSKENYSRYQTFCGSDYDSHSYSCKMSKLLKLGFKVSGQKAYLKRSN